MLIMAWHPITEYPFAELREHAAKIWSTLAAVKPTGYDLIATQNWPV